jgi:hypothetical protein
MQTDGVVFFEDQVRYTRIPSHYDRFLEELFGSGLNYWNASQLERWALKQATYPNNPIIFAYQPTSREVELAKTVFGSDPLVIKPA